MYTIMLTKAAILHRDFLPKYDQIIPKAMVEHIDKNRNCEDIAMAYVVAKEVRTTCALGFFSCEFSVLFCIVL
jgi:hypothetical protein